MTDPAVWRSWRLVAVVLCCWVVTSPSSTAATVPAGKDVLHKKLLFYIHNFQRPEAVDLYPPRNAKLLSFSNASDQIFTEQYAANEGFGGMLFSLLSCLFFVY